MEFTWTVVFVITLIFSTNLAKGHMKFNDEGWKKTAEFLKEGYNSAIKPCDDFVQYACGNWMKIDNKKARYQPAATRKKFMKELKEAIEAIDVQDETLNYKKSVKAMYDQCRKLNDTNDRDSVVQDFYHGMVEIMGTPPMFNKNKNKKGKEILAKENLWHLLGKVHRELPLSTVFFNIDVQKTDTPCEGRQASLLLTPYMDISEDTTVDEILNYVKGFAAVINLELDEKEANRDAENIVKFQQAINDFINSTQVLAMSSLKAHQTIKGRGPRDVGLQIVTVKDLEQFNPNISLVDYFRGLFTKEQFDNWNQSQPAITIMNQRFFENVDDILAKFDTETIFNYIFWRSIKSIVDELTETDESIEVDKGKCLSKVIKTFNVATARIYFDHFEINPIELKTDLNILATNVFSAFKFLIGAADWLDDNEKLAVIDKVNQISFYSGIPDWIENDTEIDRRTIPIRPNLSPVEIFVTLQRQNFERQLDYVIGLRDLNLEQEPELEVNAQYSAMSIKLKLGILIPPLYSPKYPLAAKYGFIGYVIGHELLHGFDIFGVNEIPPNAKTWLKEETIKMYNNKMDCIKSSTTHSAIKNKRNVSVRETRLVRILLTLTV